MTRIVLAFAFALGGCGAPFALHAPKTSAELAAEAQGHCRSLSTRRTVWSVTSSVLGAAAAGAGPIETSIPAADAPARTGVIVGGVVAGAFSAVAATMATIDGAQFETSCALAPTSSGSP